MAATAIHSLLATFAPFRRHSHAALPLSLSLSLSLSPPPAPSLRRRLPLLRAGAAAKSPTGPVEKPASAKKKKKKKPPPPKRRHDDDDADERLSLSDVEVLESDGDGDGGHDLAPRSYGTPMPEPPAGFVVDEHGRVLMASANRIVTMVDPTNNFPLECIVRRVFKSSQGDECLLLCPVDTPVQMLKSTNIEGWSAVSDEEVEAILPAAAFALAKIHMHLVHSGFCYTARGGFCYTEDDIFDFRTDDGQDVDGLPTEGVEITCFHMDGAHYMIYTPADPLLFVAVKGSNGMLHIADDDLLEDSAVISAIDEETEFNALVEEEAALLDSLFGKD